MIYSWQSVSVERDPMLRINAKWQSMLMVRCAFEFVAKKLPKNEGAGTQGNGQGRRLADSEQNRQSTTSINCCK